MKSVKDSVTPMFWIRIRNHTNERAWAPVMDSVWVRIQISVRRHSERRRGII